MAPPIPPSLASPVSQSPTRHFNSAAALPSSYSHLVAVNLCNSHPLTGTPQHTLRELSILTDKDF